MIMQIVMYLLTYLKKSLFMIIFQFDTLSINVLIGKELEILVNLQGLDTIFLSPLLASILPLYLPLFLIKHEKPIGINPYNSIQLK